MDNWQKEAACVKAETVFFFSETGDSKLNKRNAAMAKTYCKRCPVVAECLMHALDKNEAFGIWGSFDTKERTTITTLYPSEQIDIDLCRMIANKEIKTLKAEILRKKYGG